MADVSAPTDADPATYEDLAKLEAEFDDIDSEIIRKQYVMSAPAYAKRAAIIKRIPNFWPLVIEQAPPEVDQCITPTDSEILQSLTDIQLTRFEIPLGPENISQDSEKGEPRSFSIRFEFAENEWFADEALEKSFWFRRSDDGWSGLVSEPVKINWKKGKDPTKGLMDAAIKHFEAVKTGGGQKGSKEHSKLDELLLQWNGANTSFFTWFAFVSPRRYVSAEESVRATKKSKSKDSEPTSTAPDEQEPDLEVFDNGDSLALAIAEDVWPNAIKYFTEAQESGDISDDEFEDDDGHEFSESDEDDGGPINMKDLVKEGDDDVAPPLKKVKR